MIARPSSSFEHPSVANESTLSVLMIEGDEELAQRTAEYLDCYGARVTVVTDGVEGKAEALRGAYDCVVLGVPSSRGDGIAVCREVRAERDIPIVIVGECGDEEVCVRGLDAGADDVVSKPYSSRELLARIRANVRRARRAVGPSLQPIQVGRIMLDPRTLTVTLDNHPVSMTGREFAILRVLAEHVGAVVSRERLLELSAGSADVAFERAIDTHVSHIREKLGDHSRDARMLRTIRGHGYTLTACP